jgi:Na+/H+ antiporter NhaA
MAILGGVTDQFAILTRDCLLSDELNARFLCNILEVELLLLLILNHYHVFSCGSYIISGHAKIQFRLLVIRWA